MKKSSESVETSQIERAFADGRDGLKRKLLKLLGPGFVRRFATNPIPQRCGLVVPSERFDRQIGLAAAVLLGVFEGRQRREDYRLFVLKGVARRTGLGPRFDRHYG